MGVKLIWEIPDSESTYDKVYIYRSDSKDGTYSEIHNQDISDNTYYDMEGSTTNWYKIRFYDSVNTIWSDYSDPMQGGFYGAYCSVEDVKYVTDVPSDVTDIEIFKLARIASMKINEDIQTHVFREKIEYIDNIKTNKIDGSNKVFYTKNFPVGDMNNDYMVDETDVKVYKQRIVSGEYTETELTVSSVDAENGKITLQDAPESDSILYVTYVYTPRHYPVYPAHELVRRATAYFTAFLLKTRITGEVTRYTLDRLTIVKGGQDARTEQLRYKELVQHMFDGIEIGEIVSED